MQKLTQAIGVVEIRRDFKDSINELIEDGIISDIQGVRDYINECMYEDMQKQSEGIYFTSPFSIVDMNLKFEKEEETTEFEAGDIVEVTPIEGDNFHPFVGRVDGHRYEYVIVVDSDDNAYDVEPSQLFLLF